MNIKTVMGEGPEDEVIAGAVRQLRNAYGETQEQFANRLDATIRTITRYETNRPPRGDALVRLWKMARKKGLGEIADIFSRAFMRDFWRTLTDTGFLERLYEHLRAALAKDLETELLPKLTEEVEVAVASGRADLNLTDEERGFLKAALTAYRAAGPDKRQVLADFPGVVRRAFWMVELEDKIRRAEQQDVDVDSER